MVRLADTG